ncbi:HopJ type III effector protein [Endozoicomonas arenosclerae]|uniref:HopJ type III effector protein n=1 Tax=Endozoicomonas arenosclerae TaxID=1633495 RepID=UPI000780A957|nr:HopJ type III effector protein [Endozoicomonas arenosclerae]
MSLNTLLNQIRTEPDTVEFDQVMAAIADHYEYTPVNFHNGNLVNEAGTNEGSCKIFAFGLLNQLTEQEVLSCFGRFYREDVLQNPEGDSHGNIRNFMAHGWKGVRFEQQALQEIK